MFVYFFKKKIILRFILLLLRNKKYVKNNFICVVCYLIEDCIVFGYMDGKICFWRNFYDDKKYIYICLYWYYDMVMDLVFLVIGISLLSGGCEFVFVEWCDVIEKNKEFFLCLGVIIEYILVLFVGDLFCIFYFDNKIIIIY